MKQAEAEAFRLNIKVAGDIREGSDIFSSERLAYETLTRSYERSGVYESTNIEDSTKLYSPGKGGVLYEVRFTVPFLKDLEERLREASGKVLEKTNAAFEKKLGEKDQEIIDAAARVYRGREIGNVSDITGLLSFRGVWMTGEKNLVATTSYKALMATSAIRRVLRGALKAIDDNYKEAVAPFLDMEIGVEAKKYDYAKIARLYAKG